MIFKSCNYDVETSPKKEWTYVCIPGQLECPAHQLKEGRTIRNVDDLIKEKASTTANLIRAEIIGVVLYTGPMVVSSIVYWNAITHCPSARLKCCDCDSVPVSNNDWALHKYWFITTQI